MLKTQHKPTYHLALTLLAGLLLSTLFFTNVKKASALDNSNAIGKASNLTRCPDVEFIFAHGATATFADSQDVAAWHNAFSSSEIQKLGLKLDYYYLGQSDYYGTTYTGANIGIESLSELKNTAETFFSAGKSGEFNTSVERGISELSGRVSFVLTKCPTTRFVFGGYSEGAYILHRFFNENASYLGLNHDNVVYIATFGDPKLYLPEGEGLFPPACDNKNMSLYRVYAPNCRAHSGILGAEKPNYFPTEFLDRTGLWCTKKDVMCSNYFDLFNLTHIIDDHLNYATQDPYPYRQAAIIVRQALAKIFQKETTNKDTIVKRDTAILIDTTGSMASTIEKYKAEALRIAQSTIKLGGNIALFEYRDIAEDGIDLVPHMLCDFSCSLDKFSEALKNLKVHGGGDEPESALAASFQAMGSLNWHKGATKSLVLLTDATFHNPDHDSTTLAEVVKRSLEIDPVNFYIIAPEHITPGYENLAVRTGGKTFSLEASDITASGDTLLNRPDLNFQFESYSSTAGDVITFILDTASSEIEHFEWDLDLDGNFELTTFTPNLSTVYLAPISGFIQAKAVTKSGFSSTASATLSISKDESTAEDEPTISDLKITPRNNSARVEIVEPKNTKGFLIFIDNVALGITTSTSFTIKDLNFGQHTITVAPVSDHLRGESIIKSFSIEKDHKIPTAPNTAAIELQNR